MAIFKELNNNLSGTGNGSLQVTTTSKTYYGREPRYGTLRVTGDKGLRHSTVSLKLKGAAEFITAASTMDGDGNIIISGTSNVKNLYFASGTAQITGAKINGVSVDGAWDGNTLVAVPNDPGATDKYTFDFVMSTAGAPSVVLHTATISNGAGVTKVITFSSSGGDITPEYITLGAIAGGNTLRYTTGEDELSVESNVSWAVGELPSWLSVTPVTDYGNGRLTIARTENTGRDARKATITVSKVGDSSVYDTCGPIRQNGRGLYLEIRNKKIVKSIDDADANSTIVMDIRGITNANAFPTNFITFESLVGSTAVLEQLTILGTAYTALPVTLADEVGATEWYNFITRIRVTLASGATQASGSMVIRVGAESQVVSDTATYQIQPTSQEYLEIPDNTDVITLSVLGETKSIPVSSNVSWEIEEL